MKTLLFVGLAGVLTTASGSANAAIDSVSADTTRSSIDLSFASSTALANPAQGTRSMPRMGNTRQMKHMSGTRQMKTHRQGGNFVRQGRVGYGNG